MGVVGDDGGGEDDSAVEGGAGRPLERDGGERSVGVTVSNGSLVDSITRHVGADRGVAAGVVSAEGNVPTPDGVVLSVGCKVSAYQVLSEVLASNDCN